jgi:hypothetical protein
MIASCGSCKDTQAAKFQDETYGKGRRLHTEMVGGKIRCTVCGNERYLSGESIPKKGKKK